MNNSLENIYAESLEMLKKGHSKEEVLLKYPAVKNQLAPLLDISLSLFAMPKNIVPTPLMQRKYAAARVKNFWFTWLHVSKFAGVSMSVMLLLSAFTVMGYQTSKAAPGQTLFAVKKQAEKLQLIFTAGAEGKANVQVAIAQQRLSEAQQIFSNPNSNFQEKKAAISELSSQTSSAIAQVTTAATSDPKASSNHPLLSSLDSITGQQQDLLKQIQPDSQIKTDANSALLALKQDAVKLSEIKASVAVATTNQALAALSANPDSVAVFGQITQVSKNKITVEKTTFDLSGQTSIKDAGGNSLSAENLSTKLKVNVIGLRNQEILTAQQILVAADTAAPEVKAAETVAAASPKGETPTATQTTTTIISLKKPLSESSNKDSGSPIISEPKASSTQNTATGFFIFEDPKPQFVQ